MKTTDKTTGSEENQEISISSQEKIMEYINNMPDEIKEMYRIKKSTINKEKICFHKPQFVSIKIKEIDEIYEDETTIDFRIGMCRFSIYKQILNTHISIRK